MAGTGGYAGWQLPPVNPFHTQVTLLGYFFRLIKLHHPERTRPDAIFTTNAQLLVNQDDAILPLGNGSHQTGILTGRAAAVQAMGDYISQLLFLLYSVGSVRVNSNPPGSNREAMFLLTGYFAGITAHAVISIDDKSILH